MDDATSILVAKLDRHTREQASTREMLAEHLAKQFADRLIELHAALSDEEKAATRTIGFWLFLMEKEDDMVVIFKKDDQLREVRDIAYEAHITDLVSKKTRKVLAERKRTVYLNNRLTGVIGY